MRPAPRGRAVTSAAMLRYQIEVLGHLVEARYNNFSAREVLVDGRPVRRSWIDIFLDRDFRFDLTDDQGRAHAVEIRWTARRRFLGLRQQVIVAVDGQDRAVLDPVPPTARPGRCLHCGYELKGLEPVNGELRCPECGRHTPARMAGLA